MIHLEDVCKKFKIYNKPKDRVLEWMSLGKVKKHSEQWALKNIHLHVLQCASFGIIGLNGAGKSTLLKIITGTMAPSSGSLKLSGKVAALLELGTGFHPDLTGRENVKINGKLHGLNENEIALKFEDIHNFSELGDYFDKPIRTYSTGMQVRLSFSLATSVDPDILIVDEALSVGDAYFQQKCMARMEEFKKNGKTILFVSHDLPLMKVFCNRLALLENGHITKVGTPENVLDLYNAKLCNQSNSTSKLEPELNGTFRSGNKKAVIKKAEIYTKNQYNVTVLEAGELCTIKLEVLFLTEIENPTIGILIRDRLGYDIFGINTNLLSKQTGVFQKDEKVTFNFNLTMNLGAGDYTLTTAIHHDKTHIGENIEWVDRILSFKIVPRRDYNFFGVSLLKTEFSLERFS